MNVLSLFSGIGGLDLGLERAGMTIAGQVEIDPWCRTILAKHWPEVPRHDDVRTAAGWWGDRRAPDLVAGGFPCQPVSVAGRQLAQADSRWLWPAFAQVIRHLGPRYVLVENVPGLLGRGMGDVLGDLAALGYDAEWDCVPAALVGAPHIRNRIFIVAHPAGTRCQARAFRAGWQAQDETRRPRPDGLGRALANTTGPGSPDGRSSPGRGSGTARRMESERLGGDVADAYREPLGWAAIPRRQCDHWATEPDVGRVAHGIPRRVDRLRGLGNAVVPQVAEHIGRLIMNAAVNR